MATFHEAVNDSLAGLLKQYLRVQKTNGQRVRQPTRPTAHGTDTVGFVGLLATSYCFIRPIDNETNILLFTLVFSDNDSEQFCGYKDGMKQPR